MNTPTTPAPIADDLFELFEALREERLDDAGRAELTRRIESDPAALDAYALYVALWGTLERDAAPRTAETDTLAEAAPVIATIRPARARWPLAAAAAVLVAAAVVAIYLFGIAGDPAATGHGTDAGSSVATMLDTTGGGTLTAGDTIVTPGSEIPTGDLRLDTGSAEFQLASGVTVRLHGAAQITVHGPMSATLAEGSADFHCPPGAEGYTVALPGGQRVVDLGTRFAVRVAPGADPLVQVIEGRVAVITDAHERELRTGQTGRCTPAGVVADASPDEWVVSPPAPPVDPAAYHAAVLALTPAAYWPIDRAADQPLADAVGAHVPSIEPGVRIGGHAFNAHAAFDGSGGLTVPASPDLDNVGNRVSVAAWVKLSDRGDQAIVHKWANGSAFSLEIHRERPGFVVNTGDPAVTTHVSADAPMPVGRWVHLVGVYDGRTVLIYVDGELAAAAAAPALDAPLSVSTGPLTIGRRSEKAEGYLRGAVDDVAIFRTALTPDQIARLFAPDR